MPPTLEPYFILRAYFDRPNILPVGPFKNGPQRIIVPLNKGYLRGKGLEAELLPGSSDWFLLDPTTNVGNINVRINLRTSTGAGIYVHYDGLMKVDKAAEACVMGTPEAKSTRYGDHELFASPIMETGDAGLKWIESCAWLAEGRFEVEGDGTVAIEYQVYLLGKSEV